MAEKHDFVKQVLSPTISCFSYTMKFLRLWALVNVFFLWQHLHVTESGMESNKGSVVAPQIAAATYVDHSFIVPTLKFNIESFGGHFTVARKAPKGIM